MRRDRKQGGVGGGRQEGEKQVTYSWVVVSLMKISCNST